MEHLKDSWKNNTAVNQDNVERNNDATKEGEVPHAFAERTKSDVESPSSSRVIRNAPDDNPVGQTPVTQLIKKLEILQSEWEKSETKYRIMVKENEVLQSVVETERCRANGLQKRLKFLQDNKQTFEKLKHAFLTMKYNENSGKSVDIADKCSQTETLLMDDELKTIAQCFKSNDIDGVIRIVSGIRSMIEKREANTAVNIYRVYEMNKYLLQLDRENKMLKAMLDAKNLEVATLKSDDDMVEQCLNEHAILRRLVLKFDKFLKTAERTYRPIKYPELATNERETIDNLLKPFKTTTDLQKADTSAKPKSTKLDSIHSDNTMLRKVNRQCKKSRTPRKEIAALKSVESAVKVLEKLRIAQPENVLAEHLAKVTQYDKGQMSKRNRQFQPCDKLVHKFKTAALKSTASLAGKKV